MGDEGLGVRFAGCGSVGPSSSPGPIGASGHDGALICSILPRQEA